MHTGGVRAPHDQNNVHGVSNSIDAESIGRKMEPVFTTARSMRLHNGGNLRAAENTPERNIRNPSKMRHPH